ncbi:MAG: type III secretion system inner membrane ring subunit SctD [Chlamydiae bacterium]|nr:type III secretion system inner membrane ring subunit SctD [Chlamydiota bacterium]
MHLLATEGPLKGLKLDLDVGEDWIIGRDPDQANLVLDDNSVSRKHARLFKTDEGIFIKNLSETNPVEVNEITVDEYLLIDGDRIKIGNSIFEFFEFEEEVEEEAPKEEKPEYETIYEEATKEEKLVEPFITEEATFVLKVISGPNSGAEFGMEKGNVYILGKDSTACDIAFNDLSVSKQHAKVEIDEMGVVFIEDLGSKNGTFVNGKAIKEKSVISTQDLVYIGTSSFLVLDQKSASETIYTPGPIVEEKKEEVVKVEEAKPEEAELNWKKQTIPYSHLIGGGVLVVVVFALFLSFFGLLRPRGVELAKNEPAKVIKKTLEKFEAVTFSYNPAGEALFLVGHVLTPVDKQELLYNIKELSFVSQVEDNIVIDEYVWKNMNDTLTENEAYRGISVHSPKAGRFVAQGYVQTAEQAAEAWEYINTNFPYLDRLENRIAVDEILKAQIGSMLLAKNMSGIVFKLTAGDLILDGRYDEKKEKNYDKLLKEFKSINGIHTVKSLAIASNASSAMLDLSSKYNVSGLAKQKNKNVTAVINGKIIGLGDNLDGMKITSITADAILLEKDGVKYKISYSP